MAASTSASSPQDPTKPMVLKHSHPFTLADLEELDLNLVSKEIQRLQKSISLLHSTSSSLLAALSPDPAQASTIDPPSSDEERAEYLSIVEENNGAMESQLERIEMCKWVIRKKVGAMTGTAGGGGSASSGHYEMESDTGGMVLQPATPGRASATGERDTRTASTVEATESTGDAEQEGGVYL